MYAALQNHGGTILTSRQAWGGKSWSAVESIIIMLVVGAIAGWLVGLIILVKVTASASSAASGWLGIVGAFIARLGAAAAARHRAGRRIRWAPSSTPSPIAPSSCRVIIGFIRNSRRPGKPDGIGDGMQYKPQRDKPWLFRTYAGHSTARSRTSSTARTSPRARPASRSPSICRPRPATTATTRSRAARSARSACPISHLGDMRALFAGIPLGEMNTSMTINATAAWLLALYIAVADEQGAPRAKLAGHDPERHHQGISLARHLRVSARALAAADQGHDPVHHPRDAEVEPDERLLLPSAGGRRDAGAGAGLRARDRDRGARHREGLGRGRRRTTSARWSAASRSSSMPGLRFITEICKMRAFAELWDEITATRYGVDRPEAPAVPLRRAGELAGADRAAAGEQRLSHPDRDAGGDAVEEARAPAPCSCRPGTRRSACRGRGTSNGRCACSRSSPTRPTCSNTATSSTARPRSPQGRRS